MNSEKVKEIKEKLKERYYYLDQAYSDHLAYGGKCDEQMEEEIYLLRDMIEYINELESENVRLHNAKVVYETVDYCAEDLRKAEERIAELEKEIKENPYYAKGYAAGIKNTYEEILPQFAERLKEKYGKSCSEYYPLLLELTSEQLDETLKEFLK